MTNSTVAPANKAITVPFHGADLYVVERNGQPYTPMKPIVESMGLTWHGQHRKLMQGYSRDENASGRWGMAIMSIPLQGGAQEMLTMPLRKLPGWMATLEPSRIKNEDVRDRVVKYQNECDDVLWQYWNDGLAINPRTPYTVQPSDTLNEPQQIALRAMLESNVKRLPHAQQAGAMKQGWGKLFSHFKVPYRQIPASEFTEALSILSRHVSEWELVDESPAARTASAVADAVRQHVLRELQAKPDWKLGRWLLTFNLGRDGAQPSVRMLERDECIAGPGKLPVDRRKLAAIFHDLGRLQRRIDGLGVLESDLPPSWWDGNAISAG